MKAVLVTGAARRLGRAIALDLAADGWDVAIHYNNSDADAASAAEEVRKAGVRATTVKADLSREDETTTIIARAVAGIGPLTALVNSASLFENDDWQTATRASWDKHMAVNLRAPFVLSQAFARQLPDGQDGAIVNLLDQRLFKPGPQFLSYSLSRSGLHWLTTTLAQALAPRIRVNAVAPGPTLKAAAQSPADFAHEQRSTILGHGSDPADISGAVRYLLAARAVTGQTVAVDGGQHLIWKTIDRSEAQNGF
ncbi:MAG TPA: SDR family oxidoreductase [Rhizomicrobium sp.]|jgi:NAD(P)-dependent dehydrogenase (short-subunit alcohol dehydrogenase family)